MGIVDIRNTLKSTAGDQFTFQNVSLSYAQGGRQQVLKFKVRCKDPKFKLDPDKEQEIIFSGQVNPMDKAIEIALDYKQQLQGT